MGRASDIEHKFEGKRCSVFTNFCFCDPNEHKLPVRSSSTVEDGLESPASAGSWTRAHLGNRRVRVAATASSRPVSRRGVRNGALFAPCAGHACGGGAGACAGRCPGQRPGRGGTSPNVHASPASSSHSRTSRVSLAGDPPSPGAARPRFAVRKVVWAPALREHPCGSQRARPRLRRHSCNHAAVPRRVLCPRRRTCCC